MIIDIVHRLQRIDYLIRIKGTGTPKALAQKIGVSQRRVYIYLDLMKNLGAPIKYSDTRQSYFYDMEGAFVIRFINFDRDSIFKDDHKDKLFEDGK
ncbi:hypothetical protein [Chitinophaga filiformis]|uniref:HTH domain-containing protein n=1 Tax=Chitinophaga filiformis TaxID=104663 RepID=A0ABY4HWA8_CHIFI|nr:hypothetical protein [Chitinophaga filiformis]UPK68074.1 hypothetical protein MYF79_24280 [Chitinophaga filiformis]